MPMGLTFTCTSRRWTPRHHRGKLCSRCAGVFAEFERAMISERVRAGLVRVRARGQVLGRPKLSVDQSSIISDLKAGLSIRSISKKHNISVGSAHKFAQVK